MWLKSRIKSDLSNKFNVLNQVQFNKIIQKLCLLWTDNAKMSEKVVNRMTKNEINMHTFYVFYLKLMNL